MSVALHEVAEKFQARLLNFDLKDIRSCDRVYYVVPHGRGVTDFKAFLDRLLATPYRSYLLREMVWAEP